VPSEALWHADAIDWDKGAKAIDYPVWSDDRSTLLSDDRTRNIASKDEYGTKLDNAIWWYLRKSSLFAWREKVDDFSSFAGIAAGISAAFALWTGLLAKRWRTMKEAISLASSRSPDHPKRAV
jgi:hypothetical protein